MLATWIRNGSLNKKPKWPTKVFVGDSTISALTAYESRGYIITVWARPAYGRRFLVCPYREHFHSLTAEYAPASAPFVFVVNTNMIGN